MSTAHEPPTPTLWEQELAAIDDSLRLGQLWDHALRFSFQLGYDTGFPRGLIAGRNEEAAAWQSIFTGISAVFDAPTHAELVRLRRPSNGPCPTRCGACSQCIRAAGVACNLARYGATEFPGVAAARILAVRGPS